MALIAYFVFLSRSLSVSLSLSLFSPLYTLLPCTDYKVAYLQGIRRVKLKTRSASIRVASKRQFQFRIQIGSDLRRGTRSRLRLAAQARQVLGSCCLAALLPCCLGAAFRSLKSGILCELYWQLLSSPSSRAHFHYLSAPLARQMLMPIQRGSKIKHNRQSKRNSNSNNSKNNNRKRKRNISMCCILLQLFIFFFRLLPF